MLATIYGRSLLQPHHFTPSFSYLSFARLDTHGNGIAESSWLTDYYNNSCRYRLCDDHDARAMLACVEFFFCFFDQGIGSRSAAWASRVDVV